MIIDFTDESLYVQRYREFTDALYDPNIRYIWAQWWAWAGKSHITAQCMLQNATDHYIAIVRQTQKSIKDSCRLLLSQYYHKRNLDYLYMIDRGQEIKYQKSWYITTFWLDDPEKLKSLADFDWIWIEEATEISMDAFEQLDLRLRWKKNHKIIMTFNPVNANHRLKQEIQDHPDIWDNVKWIYKTARDNKFIDQQYLKNLERLKITNEQKYKIYAQNQRGTWIEWIIYDYDVFDRDIEPDTIWLDFWYNDPTALVYIKTEDKSDKRDLYVWERLYKSYLTTPDIIQEIKRLWIDRNTKIIADNSRPEIIEEIRKQGYNIIPCAKWSWSVYAGIIKVKEYNLHIRGENITKEAQNYTRRKSKWKITEEPEDWNDHCMDAMRYWLNVKVDDFYFFG